MKSILYNIFNPPKEILDGQIWKTKFDEFVIITDTKFSENGVVIASVVSMLTSLKGENDVRLRKDGFLFPRDRVVLNITKGPIPKDALIAFLGNLSQSKLKQIKNSEMLPNTYHPVCLEYISEKILKKIEPYRLQSMQYIDELYSKTNKKTSVIKKTPLIIKLPKRLNINPDKYSVLSSMAAADKKIIELQDEFWDEERENKQKSTTIINNSDLILRFSIIEKKLYLVCYSEKIKRISSIQLKKSNGELLLKPVPENLEIKDDQRGYVKFEFDKDKILGAEFELSFTINNNSHKCVLRFE